MKVLFGIVLSAIVTGSGYGAVWLADVAEFNPLE